MVVIKKCDNLRQKIGRQKIANDDSVPKIGRQNFFWNTVGNFLIYFLHLEKIIIHKFTNLLLSQSKAKAPVQPHYQQLQPEDIAAEETLDEIPPEQKKNILPKTHGN